MQTPARTEALSELIAILKKAHAGELAAFLAYEGHWRSLADPAEVEEVRNIARDETAHRAAIRQMLADLGHEPRRLREAIFWTIGRTIGALCRVAGWFAPMYGAGKLESGNVLEYRRAAALASSAGHAELVESLEHMADVEARHERYFRQKVESHWLASIVPMWVRPGDRPGRPRSAGSARRSITSTVKMVRPFGSSWSKR
jgi:rubrerythrin